MTEGITEAEGNRPMNIDKRHTDVKSKDGYQWAKWVRNSLAPLAVVIGILLLTGCAPITPPGPTPPAAMPTAEASPEPVEEQPEAQPTDTGEPDAGEVEPIEQIERNVVDYVADSRGVDAGQVSVESTEAVDWSDGCLGAGLPHESCLLAITPGYRVVVQVDGEELTYHTNADATHIRPGPDNPDYGMDQPGPPTDDAGETDDPEAGAAGIHGEDIAMIVRQAVMQQLGVDFDAIRVAEVEATEWPDACLGVPNPAEMCAQMITPGYRIVIEVESDDGEILEYIYHTDVTGNSIRLASAPQARTGEPVVLWTESTDTCREAAIGPEGVAFGACYAVQMQGYLAGPERESQLEQFAATYAAFSAETPAGYIEFRGAGEQAATPTEQRMLAEWARLVALEAEAGRSGASWGLAFAWQREGGIAGFCDGLTVYVTGEMHATACEGEEYTTIGRRILNESEMAQVYAWIDEYAPFDMETSDPATADGMTIHLVFSGAGTAQAGADVQQSITEFADALYALHSQSIR